MQAFTDSLEAVVDTANGFIWGPVMLCLILGTGLYLTIGLKGLTLTQIPHAFGLLFRGRKGSGEPTCRALASDGGVGLASDKDNGLSIASAAAICAYQCVCLPPTQREGG